MTLTTTTTHTISSLDIASLTGKRHDHVLRDIKSILSEAGIDAPKFGGVYEDQKRERRPCYNLPRLECDLVISGYSVKYRAAIIRRWHELEAAAVVPGPLSAADRLRMEADALDAVAGLRPPEGTYGTPGTNGQPRLGLRRACYVSQRARLEEALELHRRLRALDQAELALGWDATPG